MTYVYAAVFPDGSCAFAAESRAVVESYIEMHTVDGCLAPQLVTCVPEARVIEAERKLALLGKESSTAILSYQKQNLELSRLHQAALARVMELESRVECEVLAREAYVKELAPLAAAYREIGEATIKRDGAYEEYDNKAYSWELHDQTVEPYKTSVRELNALLGRAAEHAKKEPRQCNTIPNAPS